ncbi:MAG: ATP-binding cassette domain-containing protein [Putridiphycobacter sp.]|nr:ATP-binding cassette domain-containing protein [Putridiphycobacter sp.]
MADIVLKIDNLSKKYGGNYAVKNLNLSIEKGQVYGILGPNGSGKTTTLGMILGVINPTEGDYAWFGSATQTNQRRRIGSILEHPIFYPDLTAYRNLEISCAIKKADKTRIDAVLERVGLIERKNSRFSSYSLGMKQRLALASALLSDPEVLVLDEPTNGLDPQGISQMRTLINSIATEGKTIIVSSHLLDEIQKTCTHVAILKQGKLLRSGKIGDLLQTPASFKLQSEHPETVLAILKQSNLVETATIEGSFILVQCAASIGGADINQLVAESGQYLSHIELHKASLEEEFLNIVNQ